MKFKEASKTNCYLDVNEIEFDIHYLLPHQSAATSPPPVPQRKTGEEPQGLTVRETCEGWRSSSPRRSPHDLLLLLLWRVGEEGDGPVWREIDSWRRSWRTTWREMGGRPRSWRDDAKRDGRSVERAKGPTRRETTGRGRKTGWLNGIEVNFQFRFPKTSKQMAFETYNVNSQFQGWMHTSKVPNAILRILKSFPTQLFYSRNLNSNAAKERNLEI